MSPGRLALACCALALWVGVGCGAKEGAAPTGASGGQASERATARERRQQLLEERQRWLRENPGQAALAARVREELETEPLAQLESDDPAARAEAVEYVDLDDPQTLARLIALAREDPEPRVRAAAATALGDHGSHLAVAALLEMLEDPDPAVLVAAIAALEDAGDASLIVRLRPLEEHPAPEVRAAARSAIDYLD